MLVGIRTLEKQLDWVGRRYRFASLDEIGRQVEMGRSSDRPLAAVTFDDGYEDVYRNAFPLLSRKGIPAAVFAVTDHVGTDRPLAHDALYAQLLHGRNRLGAPGLASLLGDVGSPRRRTLGSGTVARGMTVGSWSSPNGSSPPRAGPRSGS